MSIKSLSDWSSVELKAQTHELNQVDTGKVPAPTVAQQLCFVSQRLAQVEARLREHRLLIATAIMYLNAGQIDRARDTLNQCVIL